LIFRYSLKDDLEGPTLCPCRFADEVQIVLKDREFAQVSPDGTKVAFRTETDTESSETRDSQDSLYSLYVLDLEAKDCIPVPLVQNARAFIRYAFSPDGDQLVYDSTAGGRSVWVANSDGSNPCKLADNASLVGWHSAD
jgi:Tol biopolymer transport system component